MIPIKEKQETHRKNQTRLCVKYFKRTKTQASKQVQLVQICMSLVFIQILYRFFNFNFSRCFVTLSSFHVSSSGSPLPTTTASTNHNSPTRLCHKPLSDSPSGRFIMTSEFDAPLVSTISEIQDMLSLSSSKTFLVLQSLPLPSRSQIELEEDVLLTKDYYVSLLYRTGHRF